MDTILDRDNPRIWNDILCCPRCHGVLELVANGSDRQSLRCCDCKTSFPGVAGSFDLTIPKGERELERQHYDRMYLLRSASFCCDFDSEYLSRRWEDAHWPECRVILGRVGDLNGKTVLCLGNGASTKELHFLTLGARLVCSDLSMSGVLAAKSKYNLGTSACRAAFHAIDAYNIPLKDRSVDVVYGYEFVHHLSDLHAFFDEVRRVLKPGGLCIFFDCAYSPIWQGGKRTFLWPLMKLSHMLHTRSPEDIRATYAGGYEECFLQDLAARHGFDKGFFDRVMFFQYLCKNSVGSLFGWKLPPVCYRIPSAIGRFMDRLLTDRFDFLRRSRIGLVWGFRSRLPRTNRICDSNA